MVKLRPSAPTGPAPIPGAVDTQAPCVFTMSRSLFFTHGSFFTLLNVNSCDSFSIQFHACLKKNDPKMAFAKDAYGEVSESGSSPTGRLVEEFVPP